MLRPVTTVIMLFLVINVALSGCARGVTQEDLVNAINENKTLCNILDGTYAQSMQAYIDYAMTGKSEVDYLQQRIETLEKTPNELLSRLEQQPFCFASSSDTEFVGSIKNYLKAIKDLVESCSYLETFTRANRYGVGGHSEEIIKGQSKIENSISRVLECAKNLDKFSALGVEINSSPDIKFTTQKPSSKSSESSAFTQLEYFNDISFKLPLNWVKKSSPLYDALYEGKDGSSITLDVRASAEVAKKDLLNIFASFVKKPSSLAWHSETLTEGTAEYIFASYGQSTMYGAIVSIKGSGTLFQISYAVSNQQANNPSFSFTNFLNTISLKK